ncbi:hypothetical protein BO71DRAFT_354844, partial [Aspergillus ellipticus CBS 707.79]
MLGVLRTLTWFKKEKSIIWTQFPGEELYVLATLQEAGFDAEMIHSGLTARERADIITRFTEKPKECMILVMSFQLNSTGLNLQRFCRNVHFFGVPLSRAQGEQAVGRSWRLGQEKVVHVFEYRILSTFQVALNNRSSNKALPGLMVELSGSLASILDSEEEGVSALKVVVRNGKFLRPSLFYLKVWLPKTLGMPKSKIH